MVVFHCFPSSIVSDEMSVEITCFVLSVYSWPSLCVGFIPMESTSAELRLGIRGSRGPTVHCSYHFV